MTQKSKDVFGNKSIKIPFFYPSINQNDVKAVTNALKLPLLTDGPKLGEFESTFSKFTDSKFAIGVSNATSALQLSLKALGIGNGDEVIIPDMTFVATASSVLLSGATPVLADVEKNDMNISINSIQKSITRKTKAIIPVHFAGKVCKIHEIMKIAKKKNLAIIEDCAHAIGARIDGKHVGTFGDVGCFSFYPTKNITTLEGGMVITQSKKIENYVRTARNHGITKSLKQRFSSGKPWDYDVVEPGYNYRLDEVRAALGISQLERIMKLNSLRRKAFKYYNLKLQNVSGIETPALSDNFENACHLYILKIKKDFPIKRDELFSNFLKIGIRTSVHYKPLHKFTVFKKKAKIIDTLQNSKDLYDEIISLPFYPTISSDEQNFVINHIKSY